MAKIEVTPAQNVDATPYGSVVVTSESLRCPQGWYDEKGDQFNYAAILLPEPIGGEVGWMGVANLPDGNLHGLLVNTASFPMELEPTGAMWWNSGRLTDVTPNTLEHTLDTGAGASGAPIWYVDEASRSRFLVGIHTSTSTAVDEQTGRRKKIGTRVSPEAYANIRRWIAEADAIAADTEQSE